MPIRQSRHVVRSICLAAALITAMPAAPALAWNFVGHKVITRIAYYRLTPAAREKCARIMRAHPALQRDLLIDMPTDFGDSDLWAMMSAATWPDVIRDERNPWHAKDHHPFWHFITIPYVANGTDPSQVRVPAEASTAWKPGTDPQNIIEAMQKCLADLRDPKLPDADKAVALSWYLHLVGDIHQPLHAFTFFDARFPDGDKGGNLAMVMSPFLGTQYSSTQPAAQPSTRPAAGPTSHATTNASLQGMAPQNLHFYWDNLFGRYGPPRTLETIDHLAMAGAPSKDAADLQPMHWARESFEIGKNVVWLNGKLAVTDKAMFDADANLVPPALPDDYAATAEKVGLQRVALAGERLARQLNQVFGDK